MIHRDNIFEKKLLQCYVMCRLSFVDRVMHAHCVVAVVWHTVATHDATS